LRKKYECPDCGAKFNNIFEYMEIHDIDLEVYIPLSGGFEIDIMELLEDIYDLISERKYTDAKDSLAAVASAIYAHSQGILPEMVELADKQIIEDIVKKETKDLESGLENLLKNREEGEW
jgi:hypothetical protein